MNCYTGCPRVSSHLHPLITVVDTVATTLAMERSAAVNSRQGYNVPKTSPPSKTLDTDLDLDYSSRGKFVLCTSGDRSEFNAKDIDNSLKINCISEQIAYNFSSPSLPVVFVTPLVTTSAPSTLKASSHAISNEPVTALPAPSHVKARNQDPRNPDLGLTTTLVPASSTRARVSVQNTPTPPTASLLRWEIRHLACTQCRITTLLPTYMSNSPQPASENVVTPNDTNYQYNHHHHQTSRDQNTTVANPE